MTRDPELRATSGGVPCANFTLAVDRDYGGEGNAKRPCDFIPVVAWRSSGEFASKYFHKGSLVVVQGRLQLREWTDKENQKHKAAECIVESKGNLYFAEYNRDRPEYEPPKPPTFVSMDEEEDGELPF